MDRFRPLIRTAQTKGVRDGACHLQGCYYVPSANLTSVGFQLELTRLYSSTMCSNCRVWPTRTRHEMRTRRAWMTRDSAHQAAE